jgi:hypothetical protein
LNVSLRKDSAVVLVVNELLYYGSLKGDKSDGNSDLQIKKSYQIILLDSGQILLVHILRFVDAVVSTVVQNDTNINDYESGKRIRT